MIGKAAWNYTLALTKANAFSDVMLDVWSSPEPLFLLVT